MALAVAFDDVRKNQEKRETPGKTGKSTIFLGSRDTPDYPHARLAEQDPGRYTAPHFHTHDQFQIVVGGKGKFGRHQVAPFGLHFTRAYTPYGPLIADEREGLTFIVLRTKFDPGSHDIPDERDLLLQVPDRHPLQITSHADFPAFQSQIALHALPEVHDENGLSAYALSMKPHTATLAPDPSGGAGQYVVVVKGSVLHDEKEYRAPALIYVWPDETPCQVTSGAAGLDALVVNFPRPPKPSQNAASSVHASSGFKTWRCEFCSFVYDEAAGMPAEGIAPGTRWQDVPDTWTCPDCGTCKSDFRMVLQEPQQ